MIFNNQARYFGKTKHSLKSERNMIRPNQGKQILSWTGTSTRMKLLVTVEKRDTLRTK